jgi:AraC-like DNA-binding protein
MDRLFGRDSGLIKRINPPAKRIQVKGTLYILEGEFLEQTTLVSTKGEETITMTVVRYVAEHFKQNIALSDVAKATGYNYQYLSRTFNQILGINFKSLLNQYRMEYAFAELQDTDLPISEIAYDSGFQSLRAFNHVCKEIFGRSPKELRKENRRL